MVGSISKLPHPSKNLVGISQTTLISTSFSIFYYLNKTYSKKFVHELYYSRHFKSTRYIAFKLNIIDSVIDHGIQGWEHKVRPPSKRRCLTLYYSFLFFLSLLFFPFLYVISNQGRGQKERDVLGTSSQWVALSGHCPSAIVCNVIGGQLVME